MNSYRNAIAVYANRPLLRGSVVLLLALAGCAVAMHGNAATRSYSSVPMFMMVAILGVQVAGYVGVTAIQLIWNERARLTPRVKKTHGPVLVGILLGLFGFVVVTAALAGENLWRTAAVTAEIMAVGLWLVTMRRWWMVPVGLYFVVLGTQGDIARPVTQMAFNAGMMAVSAALSGLWLWRLMALGGERFDINLGLLIRVDSKLFAILRIFEIGPMWVLACFRWRRGSPLWRIARWWPAAGDGWFVLALLVPAYLLAIGNQRLDILVSMPNGQKYFPVSAMALMTGVPMMAAMTMILSRGTTIGMQAIWPVRRNQMLAENLGIILVESAAVWVLSTLPMLIIAARLVPNFDLRTAIFCTAESASLLALFIGIQIWLERKPLEIRGAANALSGCMAGVLFGWLLPKSSNLFAAGCVLLTVVSACLVWQSAIKRWLLADLVRAPNEGKIFNI